MSAEVFVQALHHSQATGTTKVVMLAIANYAGENGAWCSMVTLAKIANVSIDNARKAVRKLEEAGEIETERNGGYQLNKPKHTRTNRYEVTLSCPEWCDRSMQHRDTREFESGPPKSTDRRNRRTDDPEGHSPLKSTDEPKYNQLPNNEVDSSKTVSASARENHSSNDTVENAPKRFGSISRAQKIANEAKRRERYLAPQRPEPVSEARQGANAIANTLPCPAGFGDGAGSRHLILVATGEGCARCGEDSFDILDAHNRLETP